MNHPEIVSYLVENNLCDFSFDANGESPLSLAVREKNYAVTSVYLTMFGPEVLENGEELIEIARANKDEKTLSLLEQNIRTAQLLRVVTTGNLQMVKECIEKGENIDQINSQGFTALGIAISQDNYEIVKYLLENKANPTIGSAIKNAANRKNKAICDLLIQKMSNVNDFDENGFTFLDYIVASPQFMADLFINLIKRGAKLEQKNKHDDTSPYDVIIDERNYEAIDALVANHIPLDVPNRYSFTHAASALNNHSFLLYIINKGGKVNFEFNEQYPIQVALKSQFIQQDEDSALEDIKLLLNPTSFEDFFATALVLLENGADIKQSFISAIRDKDPIAIFFYLINGVTQKSIFSQSHFLVESLLKFFSTDSYDSLGRYFLSNNKLLILAARFSPPEKLSFLIKKGFDIDAPDFNGMRPIHHAIAACKFGNVRVLIENCAMVQPPHFLIPSMLHFIAANEKMAYVKCSPEQFNYSLVHFLVDYLVRNGEYVDISSKNGETPLAVAIDHKNYRLAEILLQKGAENDCSLAAKFLKNMVNEFPHETSNAFKDENLKIGSKTLAMPAKSNSFLISSNHPSALFKFITLFFGNNADFNTVIEPATKRTILHIACQNHLLSFIRFLVVNGADVNIPDANGVSPMTEAIINNRPDIIELLITPRLDLNIRDSKGIFFFTF